MRDAHAFLIIFFFIKNQNLSMLFKKKTFFICSRDITFIDEVRGNFFFFFSTQFRRKLSKRKIIVNISKWTQAH